MFLFSEAKMKTIAGNRKKMKLNDRNQAMNRQKSSEEVFNLRGKIAVENRVTQLTAKIRCTDATL